jgi:hypothetical protein
MNPYQGIDALPSFVLIIGLCGALVMKNEAYMHCIYC